MTDIRSALRRVAVIALYLAIAGPACAQQMQAVTIGVGSPSLPGGGARIAKEMGLFEKHGIEPRLTIMDNTSVANMALVAGSLEFSTTGGPDVVVANARGQRLIAVTSVYSGSAAVLVLSRDLAVKLGLPTDASPAQRLAALDGLVIATPAATSPYTLAVKGAAEAVGAKVRLTYMDQPAMVAALATGAIQGFVASSPFYAQSVANGTGVVWINGPKGEFGKQFTPANSVTLNSMRDFAVANRDLMQRMTAVFADFARAVEERPTDVKAAITKVFPQIDAKSLNLLFSIEARGFTAKPLRAEDMAHEIAFVKLSGTQLPNINSLDPKSLLFR